MRILVLFFLLSFLVLPASFANAEDLSNFPATLGSDCVRYYHHASGGKITGTFISKSEGTRFLVGTKDGKSYQAYSSHTNERRVFSNREGALGHIEAMCQ